ncbi:hypothetical protein OH76DRAFT_1482802 [Lentinus brumalis]|uniref:Heme oxygenase-like protein n=1 Tax=Lentinus brumalis TaxID=2498619 RepID=A0A371DBT1_9APHY|nr:hypothetical protein OH76DRAFT_1482802 [Polyporus brumalis]
MASIVDLSKPVADILREGTHAAHIRAEHSKGAQWLARGELDKQEYVRFLMMLYHVYNAFERALEQHATHPVLAPTHNPGLFARSASLAADISYLLEVSEASWQSHPLHVAMQAAPPRALSQYVGRIDELAASPDPSRLLAHAYVRYLGDLSGGQFIRRRISKAYGLDDSAGVSFYEFRPLGGTRSASDAAANAGEMKRIKEWYRDGMNAGVGDNEELKAALLDEANIAFEFNTALFDELKASSHESGPSSPVELPSPLHSPVEPSFPSPIVTDVGHDSALLQHLKQSGKSKTVFVADEASKEEPKFSTVSVVAFIVAVSIAHFVLVVGGFTGMKGYAKLEGLQAWLDNYFGTTTQA